MSHLTDIKNPHPYTPSYATNVRATIEKVRKELGQPAPKPSPTWVDARSRDSVRG